MLKGGERGAGGVWGSEKENGGGWVDYDICFVGCTYMYIVKYKGRIPVDAGHNTDVIYLQTYRMT